MDLLGFVECTRTWPSGVRSMAPRAKGRAAPVSAQFASGPRCGRRYLFLVRLYDLMTPSPVTIPPDTVVGEAVALMLRHGVRHLPIAHDGRLVGIVSDRDLRSASPNISVAAADLDDMLDSLERSVAEVGVRAVVTLGSTESVQAAIDAMLTHNVGAVCAVGQDGELLGIVSYADILRAMRDLLPAAWTRKAG